MNKKSAIILSLILLVTPWMLVGMASKVASEQGCRLNEAQAYPCNVAGHDVGEALYTMSMMGWLGVMTFVPSFAGLVIALSMKDQSRDNVR
ncbi:MAG: hypothetical protein KME11_18300 [Timaviella obliquedivisa GSE-PSE-MK23-08B]|jgi:hypothetical protein|nr:hypothetical protein [Timaviella obliquedivisa GSE-PSE-MK23-08B]